MAVGVRSVRKRLVVTVPAIVLLLVLGILFANILVTGPNRADCHESVATVPHRPTILVLGSHPESWYLKKRLDAAATLYRNGKAELVLVSGGSDDSGYDESTAMKSMLIERGVPGDAIVCDRHGNRTLDSIVRAKERFRVSSAIIVSQRFHNTRALFFAKFHGLDAVAFDAETPPYPNHWRIECREVLARCLALWHVHVIGERPIVE